MKKTIKIVTGLIVAVLVLLLSFVLLKGCGSSKVDKSGFYSKDTKTSKTSSSSSKSSTKSSSKKSSSTSSSTQVDSSTEAASSEASVASSATTTAPTQAQAQTPAQPSQGNSANQAGTTTSLCQAAQRRHSSHSLPTMSQTRVSRSTQAMTVSPSTSSFARSLPRISTST